MRAKPGSIEHKAQRLRELEAAASDEERRDYHMRLDLSWIHHDNALDGVVYSPADLEAALTNQPVTDPTLIAQHDAIRQYAAAIAVVRELAKKKKLTINADTLKQLYLALDPEEAETKGPLKLRKTMPLHRVYLHDISEPDKIAPQMRQFYKWVSDAGTKRVAHPTRIAAKAHFTLLQIHPFTKHSGHVARLVMNTMLLHAGYPIAVLHATDRQRYYDALRTSPDALSTLITDALVNSLDSAIRYFERSHTAMGTTP